MIALMQVYTQKYTLRREKKKAPSVPVKVSVQCRSSLYEWLIKEETVVFSGNGGWG